MPKNYLNKILNARVYDVRWKPRLKRKGLSARLKNKVLIKREDLHQCSL